MAATWSHDASLEQEDLLQHVAHAQTASSECSHLLQSQDASVEREDLLQPIKHAQLGVTSAFGQFIDAHNLLVRQLQGQLGMIRGQFGEKLRSLSDEFRHEVREIREAWNAADDKRERVAVAERREVREAQGVINKRLTTIDKRLKTLESSFHVLGTQLQEQDSQFIKQLVEQEQRNESFHLQQEADHRLILEESLPALRSDLFGRIEGVSVDFEEKATEQSSRIIKMEEQVSSYQSEFDQVEHTRQHVMARLGPLEARIGRAEQMCAEAGQEITKEIMQLEAQIEAAKQVLCDHMNDYRKAGQDEAADVLNKVGSEGRRIGILEKTVAQLSGELERRLSGLLGEHQCLADQVGRDFDIAHGEISESRAQLQTLEAAIHDLKVEMRINTQRAEQDRDVFATQLSEFDAKHREIGSRLETCEPIFNRVEDVVRSVTAEMMQNPESAAAVTHCLSCGQNRSLFAGSRSPPPVHLDTDTMTPSTVAESVIMTAKRPESAGYRPVRSRPASAGKFSQSGDTESTRNSSCGTMSTAAGAAHVICRAAGGASMPRPQSSRRFRTAMTTPSW